jgi:type IV conjugative transfer system protein TraE
MDIAEHTKQKHQKYLELGSERLITLGLVGALLLLLLFMLINGSKTRVILTPPEIPKTMWVDADQASDEYLEEMTNFLNQLILNTTAGSVDYQGRILKKYACSDGIGTLEARMQQSALALKRDNAVTIFGPRQLRIDRATKRVATSGELTIWVGDKRIGSSAKTFLTAFDMSAGRICVKDFYETNEQTPFVPKSSLDGNSIVAPTAAPGAAAPAKATK